MQLLLPAPLCRILARYFSLGFVLLLNVKHRFPQTPVPKKLIWSLSLICSTVTSIIGTDMLHNHTYKLIIMACFCPCDTLHLRHHIIVLAVCLGVAFDVGETKSSSFFPVYSWMRCDPYRWTAPWTLSTITAQFRTLAAVKWNLASVRPRHLRLLPMLLSQPKLQALLSKYLMSFWCWCSSWKKFSSTEWSARPGYLLKEAAGGGGGE